MPEIMIYKDEAGHLYGRCDWNGVSLFLTNFRKNNEYMLADITTPNLQDCYINKRGQERFKHRYCGFLQFDRCIAYLELELNPDEKQQFHCLPIWKTSGKDNTRYLSLNFQTKGI